MENIKIFKDENLNNEFKEFGFVKVKLFNEKEASIIKKNSKKIIRDEKLKVKDLTYIPNINTSKETCGKLWNSFNEILNQKIDSFFTNDYTFINSFLMLKKKRSTKMLWHIDGTFYDQKKFIRPIAIWSGIEKTTEKNGCLRVVPKSHKLGFNYEPFPTGNMYKNEKTINLYKLLTEKHGIDVPLDYGEVIIHDQSLIHGSHANNSFFKKRIAYKLVLIPKYVNEFKMCVDNPLNKKQEYEFYSLNKSDLKCDTIKYYSRDFTIFNNELKNQLIETKKNEPENFPFTSIVEMEKVMGTPINLLKSKFETC